MKQSILLKFIQGITGNLDIIRNDENLKHHQSLSKSQQEAIKPSMI